MNNTVLDEGASSGLFGLLLRFVEIGWELVKVGNRIATALERDRNDPSDKISKEAMAIGLLFSVDGITKREVARRVGYASHKGLERCESFNKAWDSLQISRGFQVGNYRTSGQRRNGREMSFEDDGTES